MFRRKEESATDSVNPASPSAAPTAANGAHAQDSISPASAASAPASHVPASNTHNSYTPAAVRAAADSSRVAPSSPLGNYRPSPIAEFNRGTARSSEPARTAVPAASSFSHTNDKNAASGKPSRRVLTVGNDILLKGEIATCDRLVIEGRVEAKLSDVHTVEIAECGSFKGTAEVEDAEISGVFEGDLIVRNRIVIYTTGEVRGNISYGEIEIERGGKLTGQIKTVAGSAHAKGRPGETPDASKARVSKETVAA